MWKQTWAQAIILDYATECITTRLDSIQKLRFFYYLSTCFKLFDFLLTFHAIYR